MTEKKNLEYPENCPFVSPRDPWETGFECRRDKIKICLQPKEISLDESEEKVLKSITNKICQYCIGVRGIYR